MKNRQDKKIKVLVLGDYCLDEYLESRVAGVSPEAPILRVIITNRTVNPGMTGNIVSNLASLGVDVVSGGVLGGDETSKEMLDLFKQKKIKTDFVIQKDRITPKFSRILTNDEKYPKQPLIRFDKESETKITEQTKENILNNIKKIKDLDAIILADYNEFGEGLIDEKFIERLKSLTVGRKIKLIGDSRLRPEIFKDFNLVKINLKEAEQMYKSVLDQKINVDKKFGKNFSHKLLKALNLDILIITADKNGSEIITKNGEYYKIFASAKKVIDVCGVGDTFLAGFVLKWLSSVNLKQALIFADKVSAVAVSKPGVSTVRLSEIK